MQFLCFLYIAKINFVDIDFICLVMAQMSYYTSWQINFVFNLEFNVIKVWKWIYKKVNISILLLSLIEHNCICK